jgi:hypothetical protein
MVATFFHFVYARRCFCLLCFIVGAKPALIEQKFALLLRWHKEKS